MVIFFFILIKDSFFSKLLKKEAHLYTGLLFSQKINISNKILSLQPQLTGLNSVFSSVAIWGLILFPSDLLIYDCRRGQFSLPRCSNPQANQERLQFKSFLENKYSTYIHIMCSIINHHFIFLYIIFQLLKGLWSEVFFFS